MPGAHFQRRWGYDGNPNLHELMGDTGRSLPLDTAAAGNEILRPGAVGHASSNGQTAYGTLVHSYAAKTHRKTASGEGMPTRA